VGAALSLWGVLSLGKSFGIFVSVRKVVLHGPYRFVRHPIYLGYFLIWVGLFLINLSPAVALLVLGHMWLFRCRAKMEERGLREGSPAYEAYARETGFLLPRWPGGGQV
jgi:protein-S-isoprenylcysteine O-methyltransferase Ste14